MRTTTNVRRLLTTAGDGSLDARFGSGGLVSTDFGGGELALSVAIDRAGSSSPDRP